MLSEEKFFLLFTCVYTVHNVIFIQLGAQQIPVKLYKLETFSESFADLGNPGPHFALHFFLGFWASYKLLWAQLM